MNLLLVSCLIGSEPLCLQTAVLSSSLLQVLFLFPLFAPLLKDVYNPSAAKRLLHVARRLYLCLSSAALLDRQPKETPLRRENVIGGRKRAEMLILCRIAEEWRRTFGRGDILLLLPLEHSCSRSAAMIWCFNGKTVKKNGGIFGKDSSPPVDLHGGDWQPRR